MLKNVAMASLGELYDRARENLPKELDRIPLTPMRKGTGRIKLKEKPEDFIVKELPADNNLYKYMRAIPINNLTELIEAEPSYTQMEGKGDFLITLLIKRRWATDLAIKRIAKSLGISKKRISFAGTKDKQAITAQFISIYKGDVEKVRNIKIKDMSIVPLIYRSKSIEMGELIGNGFLLKGWIKEPKLDGCDDGFPNYFGEQRFGSRGDTHKIGYLLVRGMIGEALAYYLLNPSTNEREVVRDARAALLEKSLSEAIKLFPKWMKHERTLLSAIIDEPNNYARALRLLPRGTFLMFIHALQSFLFNYSLEKRIHSGEFNDAKSCNKYLNGMPISESKALEKYDGEDGDAFPCIPIPGYKLEGDNYQKEIMERIDIREDDFHIKSLPELSSKGIYRMAMAPCKSLSWLADHDGKGLYVELPAGSYATVFLNEIAKIL